MNVYRIDVTLAATAYVKAESVNEAKLLVRNLEGRALEVQETGDCEVRISGARYDSPTLPEVSLSPAMTVLRPVVSNSRVELVER